MNIMKNIIKISSKILGWFVVALGFSLSTVTCAYGAPEGYDIKISGTVKSATTNQPIKGIKVSRQHNAGYAITDEKGNFSFHTHIEDRFYTNDSTVRYDSVPILFADIDSTENGYFADKTVIIAPARKDEVKINVKLENK